MRAADGGRGDESIRKVCDRDRGCARNRRLRPAAAGSGSRTTRTAKGAVAEEEPGAGEEAGRQGAEAQGQEGRPGPAGQGGAVFRSGADRSGSRSDSGEAGGARASTARAAHSARTIARRDGRRPRAERRAAAAIRDAGGRGAARSRTDRAARPRRPRPGAAHAALRRRGLSLRRRSYAKARSARGRDVRARRAGLAHHRRGLEAPDLRGGPAVGRARRSHRGGGGAGLQAARSRWLHGRSGGRCRRGSGRRPGRPHAVSRREAEGARRGPPNRRLGRQPGCAPRASRLARGDAAPLRAPRRWAAAAVRLARPDPRTARGGSRCADRAAHGARLDQARGHRVAGARRSGGGDRRHPRRQEPLRPEQRRVGFNRNGGAYRAADLDRRTEGNSAARGANILFVSSAVLLAAGAALTFAF